MEAKQLIVSTNSDAERKNFDLLCKNTCVALNNLAKTHPQIFTGQGGTSLEGIVENSCRESAEDTEFEGTIKLVSGQRFPDIVVKKYYGIEVKSTNGDTWSIVGGSVAESTRVENVQRINLMFGKLKSPIEFKTRPYEECLSNIVVTHKPRYMIDMDLETGKTIFDSMGISYETLCKEEDPAYTAAQYMKKHLEKSERLWWASEPVPVQIRFLNNMNKTAQTAIKAKGLAYSPSIFSKSNPDKYNDFSFWLYTQGIICYNLRDIFSAGGKVTIKIGDELFSGMPAVFGRLYDNWSLVRKEINNAPEDKLKMFWKVNHIQDNRIGQWAELVKEQNFNEDQFKIWRLISLLVQKE